MVYTFTELDDSLIGPEDCSDIRALGYSTSGVYRVYPGSLAKRIQADVYCDMTTPGENWLVGLFGKLAFFRCVRYFLMTSVSTITDANPTSIWHALFTSIPLAMTMCFFIYPVSTVAIKWFHQSRFYLYYIGPIAKTIQLLLTQRYFPKSSFYLHCLIFSSIQLPLMSRHF